MSTLNVDTINDRTGSGGPDFNNGIILGSSTLAAPTGSAPSYTCRAWVNFDGTGTVAIREDGNVSSITDNGTGNYTVNFTTAMPDTNYAVTGSCIGASDNWAYGVVTRYSARNTGSVQIGTGYTSQNTALDVSSVLIAVFR